MSLKLLPTEIKGLVFLALLVFGSTLLSGSANAATPVEVSAPTSVQSLPSTFVVPITVGDISSTGIIAFQFNIVYDPSVIDPTGANFGCSTDGTLAGAAGMSAVCNVTPDGTLRVAAYGAYPMTGSGTILNIIFRTDSAAAAGSFSLLTFENLYLFNNEGIVSHTARDGQIDLVVPAPTPSVELSAPTVRHVVPSRFFTVPLSVRDISAAGIIAYQFNIGYNPNVIVPTGANFGCSTVNTLSGAAGMAATCNVVVPGTLRVAVYGAYPMTGAGPLLNLNFATAQTALAGDASALTFQQVYFFDGAGPVVTAQRDGRIDLVTCKVLGVCRKKF